jgi:hypothetical protein
MKTETILLVACLGVLPAMPTGAAAAQPRSYRLKDSDLKQNVIWGSVCEGPDGLALSFGGQDQTADDGRAHTRLRENGEWKSLYADLCAQNPLQECCRRVQQLRDRQKDLTARARSFYFEGRPSQQDAAEANTTLRPAQEALAGDLARLRTELESTRLKLADYEAGQTRPALEFLKAAEAEARALAGLLAKGTSTDTIKRLAALGVSLEKAASFLDAEPPARALSPLCYEAKTKQFVLFGGDHCDYLLNDLWVFDPSVRRWRQRHPALAPPPRANHTWKALGDGQLTLAGGYTYTSSTDYCGGQYRDLGDGEWVCDLSRDTWTGSGPGLAAESRTYRTGPFLPDFFLAGPRPNADAFGAWLAALPVNVWTAVRPPFLPQLNRDWGTAILDPDHDLILRWSGGHSAHGGTDVLHFHLGTGRWELPIPVEFPLGQLYANTAYPDGWNFNRRPWITGHTYQNYGYDPVSRKMLFTGRTRHSYFYDPEKADWVARAAKPKEMSYGDCFYTLTLCALPEGLIAWTAQGKVFRFEGAAGEWQELKTHGVRLPGACVDNSTVVHDAKRQRLLFARKDYGDKTQFDGQLHALDLATLEVTVLSPKGQAAAAAIPYLCQLRYSAAADLLLVGATLPPDSSGFRRTPAYDCAGNRWVSLRITGDDPSGKSGRNVSLGLVYDKRRNLFWAVDTRSQVFVLRLDISSADLRELE